MRKILVALAFVACVGMVACGGDDEPEDRGGGGSGGIDGTGGDGGTGGSGGSGGAGGVGGTGGATNENCGNGEIDEGEECDDGKRFDGDGCSSTCRIESGRCDAPWSYNTVSANAPNRFREHTNELQGESTLAICGGLGTFDGPELVYTYLPSVNGILLFLSDNPGTVVGIASTCGGAELACVAGGMVGEVAIEKGKEIYIVVDSPAGLGNREYTFMTQVLPIFQEGEECNPNVTEPSPDGICAEGLVCGRSGGKHVCRPPLPPELQETTVVRSGDDLRIEVVGRDEDIDVQGVRLVLRDAEGEVLLLNGNPSLDFLFSDADRPTTVAWVRQVEAPQFFLTAGGEGAVTAEVTVFDAADLTSETLITDVVIEETEDPT